MFLSPDLLPLGSAGTSLQGIENNNISTDTADLEATFAEVMKTPLLVSNPEFTGVVGEDLPLVGSSLPLTAELELSADIGPESLLDDIDQILVPLAAITTGPVVSDPGQVLQQTNTDPDEAKPAIIGDMVQLRVTDSERPAGIHALRSEADPFVRQGLATDRIAMTQSEPLPIDPANEIDLAKNDAQLKLQRQVASIAEDASSRLQNRPVAEATIAALPISTAGLEAMDVVQKPVSAPASVVATAAAIQAPQVQQLAAHTAKAPNVLTTAIDVPVFDENWGNALQDRVLWMTTRNIQNAEIRLNPAELGPIRVQVSVQDDAAQLTFTAHNALTRDALELALPRLREMLGENGLSLGDATVSDGESTDVEKDSQGQESQVSDSDEVGQDDALTSDPTPSRRIQSSALLDTFA